ncbi:MAG: hypothetical protein DWQ47_13965 [Acidobacteria bacterium]|nr:MAG: hypothetical protein DWQ32_01365 [Acidobacteriota bacterium]REK02824.1 MAG: hypothetical protein DWQ38_10770 [Acidobacteriota bacterium]REK13372.1 MAG: hypothetical protein DWQ43_07055 [Acidobacteriota bacterium]REK41366.1 MAG: hypothetical protein DWQ47_13965 [Acidobacteriota bacterium]
MIKDQDIEIDGLLRRLAKQERESATSAEGHIDADEISVFAENALPEKAKTRVMSHLADCDRCRTILSNLIVLRREDRAEEPETQTGAAASIEVPWYNKLFSIRNVAAAMGVLVLALGGFFVITLISDLAGDGQFASLSDSNSAPAAEDVAADPFGGEAANSNIAVAESNTSSPGSEAPLAESEARDGKNELGRVVSPAESPLPGDRQTERDEGGKDDDRMDDNVDARKKSEPAAVAEQRPTAAGNRVASSPPPPVARRPERVTPKADASVAEAAKQRANERADLDVTGVAAEEKESTIRMRVENKDFERRNGVWYDSAYTGQRTTNVRRATAEYRSLESGLRKITDKLKGTVVVVWKSKAYRID